MPDHRLRQGLRVGPVRELQLLVQQVPGLLRLDQQDVHGLVDRLLLGMVGLVGSVRRHLHGNRLARPYHPAGDCRRLLPTVPLHLPVVLRLLRLSTANVCWNRMRLLMSQLYFLESTEILRSALNDLGGSLFPSLRC